MSNNISVQRKVGVVLSYLNLCVKMGSGLITTPIMIRFLGESEFGIYSLCLSFLGYLTLLNAAVNAAYIRFYVQTSVKRKEELPELNGIFLKIFTFIALTAFVIGVFLTKESNVIFGNKITGVEYELINKLMVLMTINSVVVILNCVFDSVIIANERFIFEKFVVFINTLLVPLITIPMLFDNGDSVDIVGVTLVINFIALFLNATFCFNKLKIKFVLNKKNKVLGRSILIFSSFIVIQSIMDQLNWQIDKLLLARFSGSSQISIYTIGSQINSIYITLAATITVVFIAQINQYVANDDQEALSKLFIKIARILCIVVVFIMSSYVIFGRIFIRIWVGDGFEDSYLVGLLLMLPVTVSLTQGPGQDIMRAKDKHKLQIMINIIVCILNLFISIPLCKKFGAVGGAAGTFIGQIFICVIIQYIYYQKVGKLDMKGYSKEMVKLFPAFIIPIIAGFFIYKKDLVVDFRSLIFYGFIYMFIYGVSVWFFGMNQYEKQLISSGLQKRMKK